jgi:hypothetical protein
MLGRATLTTLALAGKAAPDWEGGTRIATALHDFNRIWSRRVLAGGAIVLLFTDGLERHLDDSLGFEMDRLHRSCRQLVWLNPLLRYEAFAARASGIRAMLHVDTFGRSTTSRRWPISAPRCRWMQGGRRSAPVVETGRLRHDACPCRPARLFSLRAGPAKPRRMRVSRHIEKRRATPHPNPLPVGEGGRSLPCELTRSSDHDQHRNRHPARGRGLGAWRPRRRHRDRGRDLGLGAAPGRLPSRHRRGGNFLGSASGGCVEGAVVAEAADVIADGKARMLEFGVADETAWQVGLSCGGRIKVYVEKVN